MFCLFALHFSNYHKYFFLRFETYQDYVSPFESIH